MSSTDTSTFDSLPFREKLDALYAANDRERRDLILGSAEARRLVRSFAVESLYMTVKGLGVADSTDLVALADGSQLVGIVDLDCWRKDRFEVESTLDWLAAMVDAGPKALGEFLQSVDQELLVLFLKSFVRVIRQEDPEEPADDPSGPEILEIDAHYTIVFYQWNARGFLVRRLIEELHSRDYGYFVTVMEAIWWSVDSELEEASFQRRNGRLQDRGFLDYYEALEVYRPIRERNLEERTSPLGSRADFGSTALDRSLILPDGLDSLLSRVFMDGFTGADADELRQEMAFLSNRVMVADGIDLTDRTAIGAAVRKAHDRANLGLEVLSGVDPERAMALLRRHHLQHVFRYGCHLLQELRRATTRALEELGGEQWPQLLAFLDSPWREALEGFRAPQPVYFSGLDRWDATGYRAFATLDDLGEAERVLGTIRALAPSCERITGLPLQRVTPLRPKDVDEFRLSAVFLTGLAWTALGEEPSVRPVPVGRLPDVRSAATADGRLAQPLRDAFLGLAEPDGVTYLDRCVGRFEEEFLNVRDDAIDPRFVTCLLVEVEADA